MYQVKQLCVLWEDNPQMFAHPRKGTHKTIKYWFLRSLTWGTNVYIGVTNRYAVMVKLGCRQLDDIWKEINLEMNPVWKASVIWILRLANERLHTRPWGGRHTNNLGHTSYIRAMEKRIDCSSPDCSPLVSTSIEAYFSGIPTNRSPAETPSHTGLCSCQIFGVSIHS